MVTNLSARLHTPIPHLHSQLHPSEVSGYSMSPSCILIFCCQLGNSSSVPYNAQPNMQLDDMECCMNLLQLHVFPASWHEEMELEEVHAASRSSRGRALLMPLSSKQQNARKAACKQAGGCASITQPAKHFAANGALQLTGRGRTTSQSLHNLRSGNTVRDGKNAMPV